VYVTVTRFDKYNNRNVFAQFEMIEGIWFLLVRTGDRYVPVKIIDDLKKNKKRICRKTKLRAFYC